MVVFTPPPGRGSSLTTCLLVRMCKQATPCHLSRAHRALEVSAQQPLCCCLQAQCSQAYLREQDLNRTTRTFSPSLPELRGRERSRQPPPSPPERLREERQSGLLLRWARRRFSRDSRLDRALGVAATGSRVSAMVSGVAATGSGVAATSCEEDAAAPAGVAATGSVSAMRTP